MGEEAKDENPAIRYVRQSMDRRRGLEAGLKALWEAWGAVHEPKLTEADYLSRRAELDEVREEMDRQEETILNLLAEFQRMVEAWRRERNGK